MGFRMERWLMFKKEDRRSDFLAHTGERIAVMILEYQIAGKHLMRCLG